MGRLHARVYSQMPQVKLVGIYDVDAARAAAVAAEYGSRAVGSMEELAGLAGAVTIATPTKFHVEAARPFLSRGVACLIEKPLARDAAEGREIAEMARAGNAIVQVGHVERFNPIVRALNALRLAPRFLEVIRVSPLPFRSLDVGVVLDVMIHDLDIVLNLVRSPVTSVDASGVSVIGEVEDVCNARIRFANGCVANVTASRLAMKAERRLRAFSEDAFVSIDYAKKEGVIARREGNVEAIRGAVAKVKAGEVPDLTKLSYADLVKFEPIAIQDVEPLRAQAEAFLAAARGEGPVVVTAADGLAAVELAERIVAAI